MLISTIGSSSAEQCTDAAVAISNLCMKEGEAVIVKRNLETLIAPNFDFATSGPRYDKWYAHRKMDSLQLLLFYYEYAPTD